MAAWQIPALIGVYFGLPLFPLALWRNRGIPVGAALARDGRVIASGHNERVQNADPIAHGEMSALRAAGRQTSYRDIAE